MSAYGAALAGLFQGVLYFMNMFKLTDRSNINTPSLISPTPTTPYFFPSHFELVSATICGPPPPQVGFSYAFDPTFYHGHAYAPSSHTLISVLLFLGWLVAKVAEHFLTEIVFICCWTACLRNDHLQSFINCIESFLAGMFGTEQKTPDGWENVFTERTYRKRRRVLSSVRNRERKLWTAVGWYRASFARVKYNLERDQKKNEEAKNMLLSILESAQVDHDQARSDSGMKSQWISHLTSKLEKNTSEMDRQERIIAQLESDHRRNVLVTSALRCQVEKYKSTAGDVKLQAEKEEGRIPELEASQSKVDSLETDKEPSQRMISGDDFDAEVDLRNGAHAQSPSEDRITTISCDDLRTSSLLAPTSAHSTPSSQETSLIQLVTPPANGPMAASGFGGFERELYRLLNENSEAVLKFILRKTEVGRRFLSETSMNNNAQIISLFQVCESAVQQLQRDNTALRAAVMDPDGYIEALETELGTVRRQLTLKDQQIESLHNEIELLYSQYPWEDEADEPTSLDNLMDETNGLSADGEVGFFPDGLSDLDGILEEDFTSNVESALDESVDGDDQASGLNSPSEPLDRDRIRNMESIHAKIFGRCDDLEAPPEGECNVETSADGLQTEDSGDYYEDEDNWYGENEDDFDAVESLDEWNGNLDIKSVMETLSEESENGSLVADPITASSSTLSQVSEHENGQSNWVLEATPEDQIVTRALSELDVFRQETAPARQPIPSNRTPSPQPAEPAVVGHESTQSLMAGDTSLDGGFTAAVLDEGDNRDEDEGVETPDWQGGDEEEDRVGSELELFGPPFVPLAGMKVAVSIPPPLPRGESRMLVSRTRIRALFPRRPPLPVEAGTRDPDTVDHRTAYFFRGLHGLPSRG